MKKYLILFCLYFVFMQASAQKLMLSDKIEMNLQDDDFTIVGKYKNNVVAYVNHFSKASLYFFDAKMQMQKIVDIPFLTNKTDNIRIKSSAADVLIFFEKHENKSTQLMVSKLNENYSLTEPKEMATANSSAVHYIITSSENNLKHLVYIYTYQNEIATIHALEVSNELTIKQNVTQAINNNKLLFLSNGIIANDGSIYILAGNKINSKGIYDELYLYHKSANQDSMSATKFDLTNHAFNDLQLKIDNENNAVFVVGFYSENKSINTKGIGTIIYNANQNELANQFYTPLNMQNVSSNNGFKDYKIKEIHLLQNGGVEVVCEKFYTATRIINNSPVSISSPMMPSMQQSTRTVETFNYEDVLLINLKSDGSLLWSQSILKNQNTEEDGGIYSSFGTLKYPVGNIYFFNDLNSRNTQLMSGYASSQGVVSIKDIQTTKEIDEWNCMPRSSKQISSSEIIMPCVLKNYLCFLKISY